MPGLPFIDFFRNGSGTITKWVDQDIGRAPSTLSGRGSKLQIIHVLSAGLLSTELQELI
jgi:hypothetical protein